MNRETAKSVNKRMIIVLMVIVMLFVLIVGRFFYIQIIKGEEYQNTAINQQTRELTVEARRGTIYDRNGKALAVSATAYKVVLSPATTDDEDAKLILEKLPDLLGVEATKIENALARNTYYEVVARRVEQNVADDVRAFVRENSLGGSISIVDDPKRYYPYNDFACHVLGFVGSDNQGLAGLEVMYEDYLRGTDGKIVLATDAVGNDLSLLDYEKYIEAVDGYNLNTTLDETIQHYLEKHLKEAYELRQLSGYAGGIVMDVETGGILAMAVINGYNLNDPFTITDPQVLAQLEGLTGDELTAARSEALNDMWRNVLISDSYEPGSTFKAITSSIAVEENIISDTTTFFCPGYKIVAGTRIHCADHAGHGTENFQQAMNNSCNPAYMDIGEMIGAEIFNEYITGFGFRAYTDIDLPGEGLGVLHSAESLKGPVQLATTSFGQTFKITPIQLITAVGAIANDGKMMKPYLVSSITDQDGNVVESTEPTVVKQVISESTADRVVSMMEKVVSEGGGVNAYAKGFRVCGKSGTSQKIDQKNEDGTYDYTSSFIAFAPADDPQVIMLLLLDEPQTQPIYGSYIVAPIISTLMEEVLTYMEVSPQYTEDELNQQDVAVPMLVGVDSSTAQATVSHLGLKVRVIGGAGEVEKQIPAAGQSIPYTGTVLLYTNGSQPNNEIVVPDLIGQGAAYCSTELANRGLNIRIIGRDIYANGVSAVAQNPAAGTVVGAGTVIEVEFRNPSAADD